MPLVPPRGETPDDVHRIGNRIDAEHARGGVGRGVYATVQTEYTAWSMDGCARIIFA